MPRATEFIRAYVDPYGFGTHQAQVQNIYKDNYRVWPEGPGYVQYMHTGAPMLKVAHDPAFNPSSGESTLVLTTRLRPTATWPTTYGRHLMSKWGDLGQSAYQWFTNSVGQLTFLWSTNGSSYAYRTTSLSLDTESEIDEWIWLRVLFTGNDEGVYVVRFSRRDDEGDWSVIEEIVTAGTTAAFPGTSFLTIGALNSGVGGLANFHGDISHAKVEIDDGVGLTTRFELTPDDLLLPRRADSFTSTSGHTVTRHSTALIYPTVLGHEEE